MRVTARELGSAAIHEHFRLVWLRLAMKSRGYLAPRRNENQMHWPTPPLWLTLTLQCEAPGHGRKQQRAWREDC